MAIPRDLAFHPTEFLARLDAVRARMAARNLDALLVFSPGSINYLSGLDDNSLSDVTALIVALDRDPVLILFWFEAGRAENSCWLQDVRLYWGVAERNANRELWQDWADLPGCGCVKKP